MSKGLILCAMLVMLTGCGGEKTSPKQESATPEDNQPSAPEGDPSFGPSKENDSGEDNPKEPTKADDSGEDNPKEPVNSADAGHENNTPAPTDPLAATSNPKIPAPADPVQPNEKLPNEPVNNTDASNSKDGGNPDPAVATATPEPEDTNVQNHSVPPTNPSLTLQSAKQDGHDETQTAFQHQNLYDPKNWYGYKQVFVMGTPSAPHSLRGSSHAPTFYNNGLLKQRVFRLQDPKVDQFKELTDVDFIDVYRNYVWDLSSSSKQSKHNCQNTHKVDGIKVYEIETCAISIPKGATMEVTITDTYFAVVKNISSLQQTKEAFKTTRVVGKDLHLGEHKQIIRCTYRGKKRGQTCKIPNEFETENDDKGFYQKHYSVTLPATAFQLIDEVLNNQTLQKNPSKRSYWRTQFGHTNNKLIEVATALSMLLDGNLSGQSALQDKAIALLLDYVKAHNFFNSGKKGFKQSTKAADRLQQALVKLTNHPDFFNDTTRSAIVQEGYALLIHGQLSNRYFANTYGEYHLNTMLRMLAYFTNNADSIRGRHVFGKAIHATVQIILYSSDYTHIDSIKMFYQTNTQALISTLTELGETNLTLWRKPNIKESVAADNPVQPMVINNIIDAFFRIYRANNHTQPNAYRAKDLDAAIKTVLDAHQLTKTNKPYGNNFQTAINLSLSTYLKRTHRDPKQICRAGSQNILTKYCSHIEVEHVFEQPQWCSNTLKLRLQKNKGLTHQKGLICNKLAAQQQHFFQELGLTASQPVKDDHNQALELVIFGSPSDWQLYGNPLFDVATNNGGIYMEGDPSNPNNQPRFYAYVADWFEDFHIWNLEHEYTHYLDGRYNQYGSFGHYPLNRTTWWTEGVAEYLAHGNCFERGLNVIMDQSQQSTPTLEEILHLDYNSGQDMVYSWSYSVHRFLNNPEFDRRRHSQTPADVWFQLAEALRHPDKTTAMHQYEHLLNQLITYESDHYRDWVTTTLTPWWNSQSAHQCKHP